MSFSVAPQLEGRRFGRLLVVSRAANPRNKRKSHWLCRCECGTEKIVLGGSLTQGRSRSCGCLNREIVREMSTTHGAALAGRQSRTYRIWCAMKTRCYNPSVANWPLYGGRGIAVCERWRTSFPMFLRDMGEAPPGRSIDRKDNDGNYEPGNCRWATRLEQNRNTRRTRLNPEAVKVIRHLKAVSCALLARLHKASLGAVEGARYHHTWTLP